MARKTILNDRSKKNVFYETITLLHICLLFLPNKEQTKTHRAFYAFISITVKQVLTTAKIEVKVTSVCISIF